MTTKLPMIFQYSPDQHRSMAKALRQRHDACQQCENLAVHHDAIAALIEHKLQNGTARVLENLPMPH